MSALVFSAAVVSAVVGGVLIVFNAAVLLVKSWRKP
jgi:hypothetical protein